MQEGNMGGRDKKRREGKRGRNREWRREKGKEKKGGISPLRLSLKVGAFTDNKPGTTGCLLDAATDHLLRSSSELELYMEFSGCCSQDTLSPEDHSPDVIGVLRATIKPIP